MVAIPKIDIKDFSYDLPQNRIAQFPLEKRDQSRLLIHHNKTISEDFFNNIHSYLPEQSMLVYNETRVIQARMEFYKDSGALIEIFCLEPVEPTREIQQAFENQSGVSWKCLVGNSKKWKSGSLSHAFRMNGKPCSIEVVRKEKLDEYSIVEFIWQPEQLSFSEVLQHAGIMPLPPYMKRVSEESDKKRYQTIYAQNEGSVAAPTAGLHFTENVFEALKKKNISRHEVTLHVGAGTFKPVSADTIQQHEMHTEQIHVTIETIEALFKKGHQQLISVGTTTLRTLESIYWHGIKILMKTNSSQQMDIQQWDPYLEHHKKDIPVNEAIKAVLLDLEKQKLDVLSGQTQLMILPGYEIKMADILITNFHMPQSTLLLLVSAFIGDDWRKVYQHALNKHFRFLSYGDSCLFFKKTSD